MITAHLEQFIQYLTYEKHYSVHTIVSYQKDLEQFIQFYKQEYDLEDTVLVKPLHIRTWLVQLLNNGMEPRTIAHKLTSLRSFYKFLMKENLVEVNPVAKVQAPKVGKKLPVFVEQESMNNLFDKSFFNDGEQNEPIWGDAFESKRNRLILLLFYTCGIRLSELIHLKQNDVDVYRKTIKVLGKRNKERIIPFTNELGTELDEYIVLKSNLGLENEYLFVLSSNQKLYPKKVYNVVKHYLSMVSTIEKRSPHVLRHTFATHLLNNGADLNAIKELLGHESLAATQVYTHNSIGRLKNIHKLRHPRA